MTILQSGDHLVSKTKCYIAIPHLNGHQRVRLYSRTDDKYVEQIFSYAESTSVEEIAKSLNEDKLILIKSSDIRSALEWVEQVTIARETLNKEE